MSHSGFSHDGETELLFSKSKIINCLNWNLAFVNFSHDVLFSLRYSSSSSCPSWRSSWRKWWTVALPAASCTSLSLSAVQPSSSHSSSSSSSPHRCTRKSASTAGPNWWEWVNNSFIRYSKEPGVYHVTRVEVRSEGFRAARFQGRKINQQHKQ